MQKLKNAQFVASKCPFLDENKLFYEKMYFHRFQNIPRKGHCLPPLRPHASATPDEAHTMSKHWPKNYIVHVKLSLDL